MQWITLFPCTWRREIAFTEVKVDGMPLPWKWWSNFEGLPLVYRFVEEQAKLGPWKRPTNSFGIGQKHQDADSVPTNHTPAGPPQSWCVHEGNLSVCLGHQIRWGCQILIVSLPTTWANQQERGGREKLCTNCKFRRMFQLLSASLGLCPWPTVVHLNWQQLSKERETLPTPGSRGHWNDKDPTMPNKYPPPVGSCVVPLLKRQCWRTVLQN